MSVISKRNMQPNERIIRLSKKGSNSKLTRKKEGEREREREREGEKHTRWSRAPQLP